MSVLVKLAATAGCKEVAIVGRQAALRTCVTVMHAVHVELGPTPWEFARLAPSSSYLCLI